MRRFASGKPRRAPFPYDLKVNGTGVMLLDEAFDSQQPAPLGQVQPGDFSPSAQNPMIESSHEWRDFSRGFGLRMQQGSEGLRALGGVRNDGRYRFASRADCSVQGQVIFGPKLNTLTPSTVDSTTGYVDADEIGGVLWAWNGRYGQKRTSDSDWNTSRKDFGSGKAVTGTVHFFTNAGGGSDFIYIGMGDSELMYKFDGTTFTQHASLYALCFAGKGRDLFRAHSINEIAKVDTDADPWTAGNWSADNNFTIGDKTSAIVRMAVHPAEFLVVFKTDGVYTLDDEGQDHQLHKFPIDSENAKRVWRDENYLYAMYSHALWRFDENMVKEQIGPELAADNDSPVRGWITTGCETNTGMYAGLYNPDTADSYLMKFGGWADDGNGGYHRIDAWHGSLSGVAAGDVAGSPGFLPSAADFSGIRIHVMYVSSIGAPTGYQRCYCFCSDGTLQWFILPLSPNPAVCASYEFYDTIDSLFSGLANSVCAVFLPAWHANFPNEEKNIRAATGTGTKLDSSNTIAAIYMRTYGATSAYSSYAGSGTAGAGWATSIPGARIAVNRAVTLLDAAVVLRRVTVSGGNAIGNTPVMNGVGVSYSVHPPIARGLVRGPWHVLCEDGLLKRDGRPFTLGAVQIASLMKAACELSSGVTVIYPGTEAGETLELKQYQEHLVWDRRLRKARKVCSFVGVTTDQLQGSSEVHALG